MPSSFAQSFYSRRLSIVITRIASTEASWAVWSKLQSLTDLERESCSMAYIMEWGYDNVRTPEQRETDSRMVSWEVE